jgi:uncharacterized RDD family membrane protein YckC
VAQCGSCGSQNNDTLSFCEECGNPLTTVPSVPPGPGGYSQPPGGYAPPPGGYTQPPGGYAQASGGYAQPPGAYGVPPTGYGQVPYPQHGANYPGPLAEWGPRALGYPIDAACIFVVLIPFFFLGAIASSFFDIIGYLAAIGIGIWFAVQIGETGQSPGMRVVGLKCVGMTTGSTIGAGMGIGRHFATIINSFICYVGWLFPLWDSQKQTLADKIVSTVVCVVPKQQFNLMPTPPPIG